MSASFQERLDAAAELVKGAEYIIVGGGSGLSAAAGLTYSGERFAANFSDFIARYGLTDMYSAAFYPFATQEEKWAYWSRHIKQNRFDPPASELYRQLLRIVRGRRYFVVTTNVDFQFFKSGFEPGRIFAVQGDYGKFQCAQACHKKLYDNEKIVREMVRRQKACAVPASLVPVCPVCGGQMEVNIRKDFNFVEDADWYAAQARYEEFSAAAARGRTLYLELGVGFNTPGIIRIPFEQAVYDNPEAALVRVNRDYPEGVRENVSKTVAFGEDADRVIPELIKRLNL